MSSFESEREQFHRQMLSSVSHDLKTPLAAVIGSLEIFERMKTQLPPEKMNTLISTALNEAYRLDNFVTNILDMAKLENGMVKPRYEASDLDSLLRDCVEKYSHRYHAKDMKIMSSGKPLTIHTDSALFCRMIGLVLDNTMKHAGSDSVVRLQWSVDKGLVNINILDNGPGIPPEKAEEIFSKYTRLKREDHQNAGTGLGLSICRSITRLLGGAINATNRPEGGASFVITLPITNPNT